MAIVRPQRSVIETLLAAGSAAQISVRTAVRSGRELLPAELVGISRGDTVYNGSAASAAVFRLKPPGSAVTTVQIEPGCVCYMDEPIVGGAANERSVTLLAPVPDADGSLILKKVGKPATYRDIV